MHSKNKSSHFFNWCSSDYSFEFFWIFFEVFMELFITGVSSIIFSKGSLIFLSIIIFFNGFCGKNSGVFLRLFLMLLF